MVRSSAAERVCSHTMMRSPETIPAANPVGKPWEKTVTLWMAEEPAGEGRTKYSLENTGSPESSSWHSGKDYDSLRRSHACTLFGGDVTKEIPEQEAGLFYIEGDRAPFNAGSSRELLNALSRFHTQERRKRMTPMEFAEQNKGNFLVVTLRCYNADSENGAAP